MPGRHIGQPKIVFHSTGECLPLNRRSSNRLGAIHGQQAGASVDRDSVVGRPCRLISGIVNCPDTKCIAADAEKLAALEIQYWVVHRKLANKRKAAPDHTGDATPMVDALTALHAALFDATSEVARGSAEMRAAAAVRVDRITGGYSEDVEADWRQIEVELGQAYQILGLCRIALV